MDIIKAIDIRREKAGLMTLADLESLSDRGNSILDPFSAIISKSVHIGSSNIFYPGVCILSDGNGEITIGDRNTFHCNSHLEASNGSISIGSSNQFGTGGFFVKANREGSNIIIADFGRYLNGPTIMGASCLASGSQVLGQISLYNCNLEAGDSFLGAVPDDRAGLIKGFGVARDLVVPKGYVISGNGVFCQEDMVRQSVHH